MASLLHLLIGTGKLMKPTDRMVIQHTCQELVFQYAAFADRGDWQAVATLFTDDATFARPTAPNDIIVGRAAILKAFKSRPPTITQHLVSNVIVNVENETHASAQSILQLFIGKTNETDALASHAHPSPIIGRFDDKFQLVEDQWLFLERRGTLTMK